MKIAYSIFALVIGFTVAVVIRLMYPCNNEPPMQVYTAVSRMETLKLGVLQKDVFSLLGISKDDCTIIDERIEDGKSGLMWTRYQLGATAFVLECQSRVKPFGVEDDAEVGVLRSACVRWRVHDEKGDVRYITLMPRWLEETASNK